MTAPQTTSGALSQSETKISLVWPTNSGSANGWGQINLNAYNSNNIYTDNGLILPKSIGKQSYIIYK